MMAIYESTPSGKKVVTSGTTGQCRCGKPAETEIQIGWIPEANAGAGGGQYDEVCWDCRDESECPKQWEDNLSGGWRIENVRPLDDDPIMKWEGEVTFDEDDIQTLQWTAKGQKIAYMKSEWDLKPTIQQDNCSWKDLDLDEIPEIAFQLVQTRKPIEVRLRANVADEWSNEQLVGFRLDTYGKYGSVVYFVDANGAEWLYCQVYRQPVAAQ